MLTQREATLKALVVGTRPGGNTIMAQLAELKTHARGLHERDAIEFAARVVPYGGALDHHIITLLERIIRRKNKQDRYGK